MKYSNIPLAQTIVTLCKAHGIKHVIISPGSRNAPLTIGFTNDDDFKCYSIVDERCAGFFALGIAQQIMQPVALVCTSGSALLNYYPAISEAYYSHIPLVVLSADRPEQFVDIGDGQTIQQKNVFGTHVHYSACLKLDLREDSNNFDLIREKLDMSQDSDRPFIELQENIQSYNETQVNHALNLSSEYFGPVHINVPFDEPLYDTHTAPVLVPEVTLEYDLGKGIEIPDLSYFKNLWNRSKRKMVLIGVLSPGAINEQWLDQLAKDDSVLVFTETTSNCYHDQFFPGIDKIVAPLDSQDFEQLQPDVLLTFGGMVVSKKIKAFLRRHKPKHHWHVGLHEVNDTFFCLEHHIQLTPNTFLSTFLPSIDSLVESNYKAYWQKIRDNRRVKHQQYLDGLPFSDFKAFELVLGSIPSHSQLQVGNSSAIRYTQLFQLRKDIHVFCNRGTSGIDGSTSTAIGAATVSKEQTIFITGDLSFFYDSNALWNSHIPPSFRIIVINNGGGGIFRILPGHKNTSNFDKYFETRHQLTAKPLCEMFGFEYCESSGIDSLKNELSLFYEPSEKPKLLEVFTPSRINDEILLEYFRYIK